VRSEWIGESCIESAGGKILFKEILIYNTGKPLEDGQARPKHVRQCNVLNN
jgi:hypothetical protein